MKKDKIVRFQIGEEAVLPVGLLAAMTVNVAAQL